MGGKDQSIHCVVQVSKRMTVIAACWPPTVITPGEVWMILNHNSANLSTQPHFREWDSEYTSKKTNTTKTKPGFTSLNCIHTNHVASKLQSAYIPSTWSSAPCRLPSSSPSHHSISRLPTSPIWPSPQPELCRYPELRVADLTNRPHKRLTVSARVSQCTACKTQGRPFAHAHSFWHYSVFLDWIPNVSLAVSNRIDLLYRINSIQAYRIDLISCTHQSTSDPFNLIKRRNQ